MLEVLRKSKNSSAIVVIVGAIVVTFIFWGSSRGGAPTAGIAARVNGKPISIQQVGFEARRQIDQYRARTGKRPSDIEEQAIQQKALQSLIDRELLKQQAKALGLRVSDYELKRSIIRQFSDENGKFNKEAYKRQTRFYPNYERDERERLLIAKLDDFIESSLSVSDAEVMDMLSGRNTRVNLEYVKVDPRLLASRIKPSDDEVEAWAGEHEAEIKAKYDEDFDRLYNIPKKVRARHILMKVDDDDPETVVSEVRRRMEEVKKRAETESFADLARQFSEDPGSTSRGGDLGFFDEKRMDPAFSKVAFSLPVGQVSDLVKTKFGYHLIKVEEVQDARIRPLEDVRLDIARKLLARERARSEADALAKRIEALWATSGDELDALLKEHHVSARTTGLIPLSSDMLPGIGQAPELVEAVKALHPEDPTPSKPFKVGEAFVFIRLKERQEPDPAELEKQKATWKAIVLMQKKNAFLQSWLNELRADAEIQRQARFGPNS